MSRVIKRMIAALTAAAAGLCMTACMGAKDAEGAELIKQARSDYKSLDSARVLMTNTETGEVEQEFAFKYDEKDILMFSYKGKSEKSEYAQYNNGVECYTYDNGELSYAHKGDEGFVLYTRAATHPQADEGLILYSPAAISDSKVTEEDGVTHISHIYDVKKIKAQAESGTVTAFRTDYYFKGEELLYFTETTETDEDGTHRVHSYKVEITERNAVKKIENTVKGYQQK
ncbi:MAG: hypothetical protein IJ746_06465 [Ruminococcus sp.]|nr:hypothetical protein [Ruminococcus sp.]